MKNKTKLQQMGAKDYYYYNRVGDKGSLQSTVCLVIQDGVPLARGVSVCSPEDVFFKRLGRAIALGRAMQAIHHKGNLHRIGNFRRFKYGYNRNLQALDFSHKAEYMPGLTPWYEEKLFAKILKIPVPA